MIRGGARSELIAPMQGAQGRRGRTSTEYCRAVGRVLSNAVFSRVPVQPLGWRRSEPQGSGGRGGQHTDA